MGVRYGIALAVLATSFLAGCGGNAADGVAGESTALVAESAASAPVETKGRKPRHRPPTAASARPTRASACRSRAPSATASR